MLVRWSMKGSKGGGGICGLGYSEMNVNTWEYISLAVFRSIVKHDIDSAMHI